MATELYREAIAVPFMSRFIVYGKRFDVTEARLRVYCITDDREEKALEVCHELFVNNHCLNLGNIKFHINSKISIQK